MRKLRTFLFVVILTMILAPVLSTEAKGKDANEGKTKPVKLRITGDWTVHVKMGKISADLTIDPPGWLVAKGEKMEQIPEFNPAGPPWARGIPLPGVTASECAVFDALDVDSLIVRLHPDDETPLVEETDYILEPAYGNIGRVDGGAIGPETPVYVDYRAARKRIDSIVFDPETKSIVLVKGKPEQVNPVPPELAPDQKRLANIFLEGKMERLSDEDLFPIIEWSDTGGIFSFHDDQADNPDPIARHLLPKTWEKLQNGGTIRVLAWGDSVTECGFIPDEDRWQAQFVTRLQKKFPKAKIELITEGWGGRNTDSYFNEPPGSPHNYQEKVLDQKPDLVVSEFVNDAGLPPERIEANYSRIRDDLNNIGAEWIILTPHYIRPDWMGLSSQTNIDEDPRPYVKAIRVFAADNGIALADAALLYGHLWRRGIPYNTLMTNEINHPNADGMSIFADALMKLF